MPDPARYTIYMIPTDMVEEKELYAPGTISRPRASFWLRIINFLKRNLSRLPFFRHPHYTPFLLLSHHRSGSTWVHTALNSHPRILSVGEELRIYFSRQKGTEELKKFFRQPQSRLVQALGCKLFYEDAYTPEGLLFWEYWRKKRYKVIHLQRRNLLRIVVSEEIARQQQHWSSTEDSSLPGTEKAVEFLPEVLMQRMAHIENLQEVFSRQLKDYPKVLTVWYEDLVAEPEAQFERMQHFLGVAPRALFTLLIRQNPEPLQELLLNYDELQLYLKGNKWESFLE